MMFGTAIAIERVHFVSVTLVLALLAICVLMQAAVNTLNDYYDFVKGADSIDNQPDPTDAVLVYNNVDPRSALRLAIGFLAFGLALGAYVVYCAGWVPLVIGLVGAGIIVLYSAGSSPLSYLPIGEYVSGLAMGGLIPLACYQALTSSLDLLVLVLAIPLMCGIGLIMFTNNTCDIEKDQQAGRKTQAVILGRKRAVKAYHVVLYLWVLAVIVLVAVFYPMGLLVIPFMLLILYPGFKAMLACPLTLETRGQAMPLCLNLNIPLAVFYVSAILLDGVAVLLV